MRKIDFDSYPHLFFCGKKMLRLKIFTLFSKAAALWWRVNLGRGIIFNGLPKFQRHPDSSIMIGDYCTFNSSHTSNLIGINRPCIISTLKEKAVIDIGNGCGFSGTVIGAAQKIVVGNSVRCGANTTITDTDWHCDDSRSGFDAPVIIRDNVWLGFNVTVLKGVTIGENTLVAAGSIVTNDLPANVVAGGQPAKILKKNNRSDEKIT